MGEQPVGRLLLSFSLPALVGMGVQATYNIVDAAFVGRARRTLHRLPQMLVAVFNREPEFVGLASRGLRIAALAYAPVGATVIFTAFFQAIGRALPAMFLSLARQFIFYLPALLLLARLWGERGFWFAIPVSDLLATVATTIWTAAMFRRLGIPLFVPARARR